MQVKPAMTSAIHAPARITSATGENIANDRSFSLKVLARRTQTLKIERIETNTYLVNSTGSPRGRITVRIADRTTTRTSADPAMNATSRPSPATAQEPTD